MAAATEENLVDTLRQRTENEEIKQYLKSTLGGYTKKSVMEYLALLQKQQQTISATFNRNMQLLLDEKEGLKKENEKVLSEIAYKEYTFKCQAETLENRHLEQIETLQAENSAMQQKSQDLENNISQMMRDLSESEEDLVKLKRETQHQAELLASEKQESDRQRELVSQYAGYTEELQKEIDYLKDFASEDKVAKLNEEIGVMIANCSLMETMVSQLKEQLAIKDSEIDVFTEENETLRLSIDNISRTLENLAVQNEKLVYANKELAKALEDENKKAIRLLHEKSDETVEKLVLRRKLEGLNNKLSFMELNSRRPDKPAAQVIIGAELFSKVNNGCAES
jgi:hypothetical protein